MKVAIHLGLGDAIVCAPIIAKLAQENDAVQIRCWKHNEVSVKSFFVNYPNVEVVDVSEGLLMELWSGDADLKLGYYNKNLPQLPDEDFVEWFYRQAEMDIAEKDRYCPIALASTQLNNCLSQFSTLDDWSLVHDDIERGFIIDVDKIMPIARILNTGKSILVYSHMISIAKEIHCIDSSFIHLVECLPTTGKLFYHKYARPNSPDYKYLKKEWEILT